MIKGLRTAVYFVEDLKAAAAWYKKVTKSEPYYDTEYYVGFNVGGFELGLHPIDGGQPMKRGDSVACYWAVDDADAACAALLALGASADQPVQDVGGGIRLGTVKDPWGNTFGVIQNPTFKFSES